MRRGLTRGTRKNDRAPVARPPTFERAREADGPGPAPATIAHVPPLIPLRHLFDNPERAGARLSPDGRRLSWVAPRDGVMNVWVRDVAGGDAVPVTNDRDRGVRSYLWSRDSTRILFHRDAGGDENHHLLAVDAAGGDRERDLTPFPGVRGLLIAAPRATPRHVLVSMNLRDRSVVGRLPPDPGHGTRGDGGPQPGEHHRLGRRPPGPGAGRPGPDPRGGLRAPGARRRGRRVRGRGRVRQRGRRPPLRVHGRRLAPAGWAAPAAPTCCAWWSSTRPTGPSG